MENYQFIQVSGQEIKPYLQELGQLRMDVFYDFPYLYHGDLTYEEAYLQRYLACELSFLSCIFFGGKMIGATTGMPMVAEIDAIRNPFEKAKFNMERIFYFGESILLPEHRGLGFGHRFFDDREDFARKNGFSTTTFCSVVRDEDHPLKPTDYRPNHEFWIKRGYTQQLHLSSEMDWMDRNEVEETSKKLIFWTKQWK